MTEEKKNRRLLKDANEGRAPTYPLAKFSLPRITSENQSMYVEDAETIIRLDGSYGTFYHYTQYCAKPGWKLLEVANLDMQNPEHRQIQADADNRIAGRGTVDSAMKEKNDRIAQLEAELAKKGGGEKQLPHEMKVKTDPNEGAATEGELKEQLMADLKAEKPSKHGK